MDGTKTYLFMLFEINRDEEKYLPESVAIQFRFSLMVCSNPESV